MLFFFLSGLLIVQSAERRCAPSFWTAHARRILPGLVVALVVSLALAVLSGGAPDALEAARYVLRGLSLVGLEHQITRAYAANPYPGAVNGALWSLQYEVAAYAICFATVKLDVLRRLAGVAAFLAAVVILACLAPVLPGKLATFAPLFLAYAFGTAAWRLRAIATVSPALLILSVLVAVMAKGTPSAEISATLGVCLAVLLMTLRLPAVTLKGDISFGIYIYGWPVAQSLVALMPGLAPLQLAGLSIVCTLPVALTGWTLVERPSLPMRIQAA